MSDQAPERSRGGGNVFTRKIGPLPMWQWFLIALAMVGVYVIYEYRKNKQAAASAANTAAGTSTGGTTGAGQVPQFVNQTYTMGVPPTAQPPPPSHRPGPPSHRPGPPPAPQPAASPNFGYAGLAQPVAAFPKVGGGGSGTTLGMALSQLQAAGYGISSVTYGGQPLTSSLASGFYSWPVQSVSQQGNQAAIVLQPQAGYSPFTK